MHVIFMQTFTALMCPISLCYSGLKCNFQQLVLSSTCATDYILMVGPCDLAQLVARTQNALAAQCPRLLGRRKLQLSSFLCCQDSRDSPCLAFSVARLQEAYATYCLGYQGTGCPHHLESLVYYYTQVLQLMELNHHSCCNQNAMYTRIAFTNTFHTTLLNIQKLCSSNQKIYIYYYSIRCINEVHSLY